MTPIGTKNTNKQFESNLFSFKRGSETIEKVAPMGKTNDYSFISANKNRMRDSKSFDISKGFSEYSAFAVGDVSGDYNNPLASS